MHEVRSQASTAIKWPNWSPDFQKRRSQKVKKSKRQNSKRLWKLVAIKLDQSLSRKLPHVLQDFTIGNVGQTKEENWEILRTAKTMHSWLRSIKGGQFRLVNFASHFIRVQIFQIDFPLILSASKYFRYISLSFYICRGQNEHFSINSVRKTGRVELCQIFDLSDWCTDICKTQFPTFKP